MSHSVQAAITEYSNLGGLHNERFFLTVLEAGKSKMKVLVDPVSHESPLPGLQVAVFSLCPHMAEREKKREKALMSFYEGTNPIHMGSILINHLPKSLPTTTITLGVRTSTYELGKGDTNIQSMASGYQKELCCDV